MQVNIIDVLPINATVLRTYSTFLELMEGHSGQELTFRTDGADGTNNLPINSQS